MVHYTRRFLAALLGASFVLAALTAFAGPASARPNCDVPNPPPICERTIPDPPPRYPDLQVAIAGPSAANTGASAAYTVTVTNPAATDSAAASAVRLSVSLSAGMLSGASGSNGFSCSMSGGTATCTGGMVAVGASATITLNATMPSAAGTVTATATVDPLNAITERNESNNTASVTTTVSVPAQPDLVMSLTGPSSVRASQAHSGPWVMTITNQGNSAASGFSVQWLTNWSGWVDPAHSEIVTGPVGYTCTPPAEYVRQTINCYTMGGSLAPGATSTITLYATPPATAFQSLITATADYLGQVAEPNESNNVAQLSTTITS